MLIPPRDLSVPLLVPTWFGVSMLYVITALLLSLCIYEVS